MKYDTLFNIGDKVYFIYQDEIRREEIQALTITDYNEAGPHYVQYTIELFDGEDVIRITKPTRLLFDNAEAMFIKMKEEFIILEKELNK